MMMNGSSHDWKFTTISRYTRRMETPKPANSPITTIHRLNCPRTMTATRAATPSVALDDPRNIVSHPAEIASLDGAENIDNPVNVVMD